MALNDEKPDNEDMDVDNDQSSQETPKEPDKRLVVILAAVMAVVLAAVVYFMFFSGNDEEKPQPQETETSQGVPSKQPSDSGSEAPPSSSPTSSSVDPSSKDDMQKVGKQFVEKFGAKGGSAEDLANSVQPLTSTALYETLKVTDPKGLPEKGTVKFNSDSGTVTNPEGVSLYSFTMKQIKDTWVVDTVTLPEQKETKYDKDGFPIEPPAPPFSSNDYGNFFSKAIGVSKTYFEYDAGTTVDARKAQMKKAVHNGSFPDPKDYGLGTEGKARTYSPQSVQVLDARTTEGLKAGTISVYMEVSVTDLALKDKSVIDKQKVVIEFSWNKDLQLWEPSGFKVL